MKTKKGTAVRQPLFLFKNIYDKLAVFGVDLKDIARVEVVRENGFRDQRFDLALQISL